MIDSSIGLHEGLDREKGTKLVEGKMLRQCKYVKT